jgi:hypothetical protein
MTVVVGQKLGNQDLSAWTKRTMCALDERARSLGALSMTNVAQDDQVEQAFAEIYRSQVSRPERESIGVAFAFHRFLRYPLQDVWQVNNGHLGFGILSGDG